MDKEETAVPTTEVEHNPTPTPIHLVDEELVHHHAVATEEIDHHYAGAVDIQWAAGGVLYSVVHAKPHQNVKRSWHHPHEV